MGQCMSRKAATFAASAVAVHQQGTPKHRKLRESPEDENKGPPVKKPSLTKGVATSFGFRRRPASAVPVAGNPTAARRLANASSETIDSNGNTGDTEPLTTNIISSGRSTPHRLPPPKKESAGTKVSRFGFRQNNSNRLNKIADVNICPPREMDYGDNNNKDVKDGIESAIKAKVAENKTALVLDNNRNKGKYRLQSTQLPKPQAVKIMESKTAKTLANNNKKVLGNQHTSSTPGDESASMTEDSGVGDIQQLDRSPVFRRSKSKPRTLEMVVTGNTFDVRDFDETLEENTISLSLPPLPSAFQRHSTTGYVRDRASEYQRNIDRKLNREREETGRIRRNSLTSSEASSHYEEEKNYRDKQRSEKIPKSFLKTRVVQNDSSPHSSDDQMWGNPAGEAMAEDFSCSFSSSDESKDKEPVTVSMRSTLQNLMAHTLVASNPKNEIRNIVLSIEDPKFAALAASTNSNGTLLMDETSPVDSIACSISDASELLKRPLHNHNKNSTASSTSKDVNEKLTISSPGSPTNASNSFSMSEGREDFLIDDEIADQPALMFDDTITNASETVSNHTSEATPTLVDSTPKPRRRALGAFEGSPLVLRNKKMMNSRTGSLDTLSPCESIGSDDYIMDFELSQSSGMEDVLERTEQNGYESQLDLDVKIRSVNLKSNDIMRDWSALLNACENRDGKRLSSRPSRLLRSRAGTPSSVPDSPRSVESLRPKAAVSQTSLRLSSRSSTGGYDSDDSAIKVDRAHHCAMQQDVMNIKTMLMRLKRVLHEPADEDFLLKSETRNPLENGYFNGFGSDCDKDAEDPDSAGREELADLRRQVLFLQGQLEDRERTVHDLQEEMVKLVANEQNSQSAPASVTAPMPTCNAATQTERIRPISAGPSLLQSSPTDGTAGSLVSASEPTAAPTVTPRRSRPTSGAPPKPPSGSRLWRMPGEPPSPQQRFNSPSSSPSSIPRRSCSRPRANVAS